MIHVHADLSCGHAAALLSRHLNVPSIVTLHGLDELAQGLATLLQSAEIRSRLGASARETILNRLTSSRQAQCLGQS